MLHLGLQRLKPRTCSAGSICQRICCTRLHRRSKAPSAHQDIYHILQTTHQARDRSYPTPACAARDLQRPRSQKCKPRLQSSATDAVVRLRRAGNSQQAHSSYEALPSANLGKQCEPRLAVPEISGTASRSRPNQCNQLVEETTGPSRSTNTLTART